MAWPMYGNFGLMKGGSSTEVLTPSNLPKIIKVHSTSRIVTKVGFKLSNEGPIVLKLENV